MERRTALRTAATGVLAGLAFGVGTAGAQLPQPELPAVQVPDAPTVQLPQAPSVQVPDVPSVQVPQVPSAPDVPSVQLPQVPRVTQPAPVPSVSIPRTPVTSGGGGSSSPGGSGGGGSAGAAAPGGSEATTERAGGGDEGDAGGGQAAPRRRSAARRDRQRRGGAAREARVRKTVKRLAGCLDDLRLAPRRVLVLRSGFGRFTQLSRSQVADRLDLAAPQVKRLERRALRRLRQLHRSGGCGAAPASVSLSGSTGEADRAATPGANDDASGGGGADGVTDTVKMGLSAPASAVKDLFETSRSSESGTPSNAPATVVPQPSAGIGGIWAWLAFLAGLGLLAFAVKREQSA